MFSAAFRGCSRRLFFYLSCPHPGRAVDTLCPEAQASPASVPAPHMLEPHPNPAPALLKAGFLYLLACTCDPGPRLHTACSYDTAVFFGRPRTFGASHKPRSKARRHRSRFFIPESSPVSSSRPPQKSETARGLQCAPHVVPVKRCGLSHCCFTSFLSFLFCPA